MSIRVDWQKIKDQIGVSNLDTPILFMLPSAGRQLLLAMTERLTYEATYRLPGYDYSDFDELQSIVATLENGLMEGINMQDIVNAIDRLTEQVSELQCPDVNIDLTTCNTLENNGFPEEPPSEEVMPTYPQPKPTTPEPTAPTYEEYKCKAAHVFIDNVRVLIADFMELTSQRAPYTWIVDLLTNEEFGTPIYSVIISIFNFITNQSYTSLKQDILDAYDTISETMICDIFSAETPEGAYNALSGTVSSLPSSWVVKYAIRTMVVDLTTLDALWVEGAVDTTGYGGAECCEGAESPSGLYLWNVAGTVTDLDDAAIIGGGGQDATELIYNKVYKLTCPVSGGYPWYGASVGGFFVGASLSEPVNVIYQTLGVSNYTPFPEGAEVGWSSGYKFRLANTSDGYAYFGQLFDGFAIASASHPPAHIIQAVGGETEFVLQFKIKPVGIE
jgi:hypothetical protein